MHGRTQTYHDYLSLSAKCNWHLGGPPNLCDGCGDEEDDGWGAEALAAGSAEGEEA